ESRKEQRREGSRVYHEGLRAGRHLPSRVEIGGRAPRASDWQVPHRSEEEHGLDRVPAGSPREHQRPDRGLPVPRADGRLVTVLLLKGPEDGPEVERSLLLPGEADPHEERDAWE